MRAMFVNASPALFNLLTRGVPLPAGALMPPIQCVGAAWITLGIMLIPERFRKPVVQGILVVIILGTLRDQILLITVIQAEPLYTIFRSFLLAQKWFDFDRRIDRFSTGQQVCRFTPKRQGRKPIIRSPQQQRTGSHCPVHDNRSDYPGIAAGSGSFTAKFSTPPGCLL
jgi:hypothetical protein